MQPHSLRRTDNKEEIKSGIASFPPILVCSSIDVQISEVSRCQPAYLGQHWRLCWWTGGWWGFNFLYWKVFINSDDNSLSEDLGMEWWRSCLADLRRIIWDLVPGFDLLKRKLLFSETKAAFLQFLKIYDLVQRTTHIIVMELKRWETAEIKYPLPILFPLFPQLLLINYSSFHI